MNAAVFFMFINTCLAYFFYRKKVIIISMRVNNTLLDKYN